VVLIQHSPAKAAPPVQFAGALLPELQEPIERNSALRKDARPVIGRGELGVTSAACEASADRPRPTKAALSMSRDGTLIVPVDSEESGALALGTWPRPALQVITDAWSQTCWRASRATRQWRWRWEADFVRSARFGDEVKYVGTDVVPELLDFARERAARGYSFVLSDGRPAIQMPCGSADMITAFSLFTHLHRSERVSYLREASRVLRPEGQFIFSFLEPWHHRAIFCDTLRLRLRGTLLHHNAFALRQAVRFWAPHYGFRLEQMIPASRLGQTVAVLRKS
jgi:SAM-dependent methyltransferase